MNLTIRTILRTCTAVLLGLCTGVWSVTGAAAEPTRLIVKWKDDAARQRTRSLALTRDRVFAGSGHTLRLRRSLDERMDVLQLDASLTGDVLNNTLASLRDDPRLDYAVVDEKRHAHALPNDQFILATSGRTGQWYLLNTQTSSINAVEAWDLSKGGSAANGVVVAVLDTGIRAEHPDLAGKLLTGFDFVSCDQKDCNGSGLTFRTANDGDGWDAAPSDPGDWISETDKQSTFFSECDQKNSSWHGTRVAGIIGASTGNGIGIAGIGWNARILPVRVLGKCGGYDSDIIAAMKWAAGFAVSGVPANANPARIINLSLGSAGACTQAYQDTINQIVASGVSVVASAGNDGKVIDTPANCTGVISVVGVRNMGSKVGYSNLGAATIAAPAGNCINTSGACLFPIDTTTNLGTTTPGANDYTDQTAYNLGTSFSAPIVSGTLALMLGSNSTLTPAQLRARLQASAMAFPAVPGVGACHIPTSSSDVQNAECNCSRTTCGAGLTNAKEAVLKANQSVAPYIRGAITLGIGNTVTLDASGSTFNDSLANFSWSLQSGGATLSAASGSSISVTAPTTPGVITLLLNVTDGSSSGSLSHSINVYGPPVAAITTSASSVTAGQTLTLNGATSYAQDSGYLAYAWTSSSGTLSSSNGTGVTFTAPASPGTATVTLQVTDQLGQVSSQSVNISVVASIGSSSSSSSATSSASGVSSNATDNGGGSFDCCLLFALGIIVGVRHASAWAKVFCHQRISEEPRHCEEPFKEYATKQSQLVH